MLIYAISCTESLPSTPLSHPKPTLTPPLELTQPLTIHVYSKHQQVVATSHSNSCLSPSSLSSNLVLSELDPSLDLPITLRKGKHHCTYPISSFMSYDYLSPFSCSFIATLDFISVTKIVHEALTRSG